MARTAKARIFRSTQTAPNATTVRDLATAFGTAANNATTAAFPAAGASGFRWNPHASGTAAAPPAVGAAGTPTGNAWRDTVAEHITEPVTYALGTWTVRVRVNKTVMTVNASVTVRVTVIVYRVTSTGGIPAGAVNNGEIGRVVMADTALPTVNAAVTISGSFSTTTATALGADEKIQVECYVQNIVNNAPTAAVAAYTVAFVVDETSANAASFTAIPAYDIRYTRAYAVTAIGVAGATRRIIALRSFAVSAIGIRSVAKQARPLPKTVTAVGVVPKERKAITTVPKTTTAIGVAANPRKAVTTVPKTTTAVGVADMARRLTAAKSFATMAVGSAAMARAATYRKAITTTAIGSPAVARRLIMVRSAVTSAVGVVVTPKSVGVIRGVVAVGSAAMARRVTAAKSVSASAVGVANFGRALVFGRQFGVNATGVPSGRIDMPIDALNRIPPPGGTPDWPLNPPTKVIAGITRDSLGAVVGGATVKLIRQSDDQRVAVATSHATTGAYSFTRGGDDPNTYRVLATKAGVPEIHGVSDALVPA